MKLPPSIHTNLPAPVPSSSFENHNVGSSDNTSTNGYAARSLSSSPGQHGIIETLLKSLLSPVPYGPDGGTTESDLDYEEKAVRVLLTFLELGVEKLSEGERRLLGEVVERVQGGKKGALERWGLSEGEWDVLVRAGGR